MLDPKHILHNTLMNQVSFMTKSTITELEGLTIASNIKAVFEACN